MNVSPLQQLRRSALITALLVSAIGMSACQQQQEPDASAGDDTAAEQAVPMSAEPAEPNDMTVTVEDATLSDVQDDTVASVNANVSQVNYLCTPALKVQATYKDGANQAVIATDRGTLTLNKTNEGTIPEVYEASTAIDGAEGYTQWRVANEERETAVMRTAAGADQSKISTYDCKKAG